jgi:polyisoprenoid-binding protein YceI
MKLAILTLTLVLAAAARSPSVPAVSWSFQDRLLLDSARSRIWFEANATLGDFTGAAQRFRGWTEVTDSAGLQGVAGRVEIDVASFKTGIGMRDGHLRGDMQADRHPHIVFELSNVVPDSAAERARMAGLARPAEDLRAVLLRGILTIRDQTRDVEIPAFVRVSADSVRAVGRLRTRFTDFGMKPPTRLFGTTRVKNDIVLAFDALFSRQEGQ